MVASILMVDDDPSTCEMIQDYFLTEGYDVHVANDGQEALEMVKANRPSVVIADYRMPKMNGIELLKEIRQSDKNLPVIIMTGFPDEFQEEYDLQGPTVVIEKPPQMSSLEIIIKRLASVTCAK